MLRFFFGQGWMVGWHLAIYLVLLIGMVLPIVAFLPLKSPGEKPDLPSPGSFGLVLVIECAAALVTLIDSILLCSLARGPWFHKVVFALGMATLVGAIVYWLAVALAEKQNAISMFLLVLAGILLLIGNLYLLHYSRSAEDALTLQFSIPVLVILILLSLPVVILLLLVPLGLLLERFQH